jgi:hypothetical protein
MNNNATRFYQEVKRTMRVLTTELEAGKHPGQPAAVDIEDAETGEIRHTFPFIWAASVRNLGTCTTDADATKGRGIAMLPFALFCERFVEKSQTFATAEQIEQYSEFKRVQKAQYDAIDNAAAKKFEISLPPPATVQPPAAQSAQTATPAGAPKA